MKKNQNRLIIDCSSLIYSAFFTQGALSYNGQKTGVIFGFLKKVLSICKEFETNKIYFCWDTDKKDSKRKKEYPEYKENRNVNKKSDEEKYQIELMLKQAIELHDIVLPSIGFKNLFQQIGFEADDLMALIAKGFNDPNNVIMITADADMYQCLDLCSIVNPSSMGKMTAKKLLEEYKVTPTQWPICKSIGGCTGDNVIGIRGVSDPKKKTSKAMKYICGDIKKGIIYDRITSDDGQKIIHRNLPIVTLPYKESEIKPILIRRDKITKQKLINAFDKYKFKSLLTFDNFKQWEKIFCNSIKTI